MHERDYGQGKIKSNMCRAHSKQEREAIINKRVERGKMRIFWEREREPLEHVCELDEGGIQLQGKRKSWAFLHVKLV